jgi:hypothetical protein
MIDQVLQVECQTRDVVSSLWLIGRAMATEIRDHDEIVFGECFNIA